MFKNLQFQFLGGARGIRRLINYNNSFFKRQNTRSYATYKRFNNTSSDFNLTHILYNRRTAYFGAGLLGFYVYNLDEAPFSKRLRFIWIPYWLERKIGDYSYRQIMYQYQNQIVPTNDPLYSKIGTIMNKLLTVAISSSFDPTDEKQRNHLESLNWQIHIIQVDPRKVPPNAFILPNGKIFIFSSILPICKNDDGLATVLSHELSHQLAHHSSEQLSKQPFYIILSTALYSLTGISWFNDLLIEGLIRMPASREMESEADRIGCELMARLCFDVKEAVKFWGRMNQYEENLKSTSQVQQGLFLEFFSTHPATSKRVHDIQASMAGLESIKESVGCYEFQFGRFSDTYKKYLSH